MTRREQAEILLCNLVVATAIADVLGGLALLVYAVLWYLGWKPPL